MQNQITRWVKNHSVLTFLSLTFASSWIIQIPLALQEQGFLRTHIPFAVHTLSAYGPMLAALLVTGALDGRAGIKELLGRMTRWRVHYIWWLFAVTPLMVAGLTTIVNGLVQGEGVSLSAIGRIDFLPDLGIGAVIFWVVTFGLGEETGWRGFLLPRLQQDRSNLIATFILWFIWALWHLPLFFYSYDVSMLPGFLMGLLAGAINFTWLYNSTGESILLVAVFHGLFNTATACSACKTGIIAPVVSVAVMIWAVLLVVFFKPVDLSTFRFKFGR